jgi:XTP/dITP diphosphohydrolase
MTRRVVLASRNAGKLRELEAMLSAHGFEVLPISRWDAPEPEESAPTFVENALIKARAAAAVTGLPCIADDSGLEVDALDGAPGVHSARFAGPGASDADNVARLLSLLEGVAPERRSARFRCAAVYLAHPRHPAPIVCEGAWEGYVLEAPRGEGGFGYDPVFLDPSSGLSAAELDPGHKNRISHRARAVGALVSALGRA